MDIYDLTLTTTPRVGNSTAAHLIRIFGSAEAVFKASYDELIARAELNDGVARAIVQRVGMREAESEIAYCAKHNICAIASTDELYPPLLREINDPPHVIYLIGNPDILRLSMISMVGTRRMSNYGQRATFKIVEELAQSLDDIAIVSGLAHGIDGAAHRAALQYSVPTIAIVANALPKVTPTSHTTLARAIIDSGGAIVSEFRHTMADVGKGYISRNRIIAAISMATIVVESAKSGGSMRTADFAFGYGRVVGAVPGRIEDNTAQGCNEMIASRRGVAINSAQTLIREVGLEPQLKCNRVGAAPLPRLADDQLAVMRLLSGGDPVALETLEEQSKLSITAITGVLLELELMGYIASLPGSLYSAIVAEQDVVTK